MDRMFRVLGNVELLILSILYIDVRIPFLLLRRRRFWTGAFVRFGILGR